MRIEENSKDDKLVVYHIHDDENLLIEQIKQAPEIQELIDRRMHYFSSLPGEHIIVLKVYL